MDKIDFSRKSKIDKLSIEELKKIVSSCDSQKELAAKLGYASCSQGVKKTIDSRLEAYNISVEHFTHSSAPKKYTNVEQVLCNNSPASDQTIKNQYFQGKYTEYKCAICGLPPFQNNKELVLTLDHINGNHKDSRIENLRQICPNCDRQTDTFSGRNHNQYENNI